jgi:serine/threonine-protein kinase RsbW
MDDGLIWLRLPAAMPSLMQFHEFAHEGARRAGLSEAQVHKLDLLLEELLVNVIHYAYPPGEAGEAAMGYAAMGYAVVEPQCLRVEIEDAGKEFNPLEAEDPDLALSTEDRPIGGLGIYLVKTMADSVSYRREDGKNILAFQLR